MNRSELVVGVGFAVAAALFAAAFVLPFVIPVSENLPGPSAGMAPLFWFVLAMRCLLWFSLPLALFAAVRFRHLKGRYRVLGILPFCVVWSGFWLMRLL